MSVCAGVGVFGGFDEDMGPRRCFALEKTAGTDLRFISARVQSDAVE